MQVKNFFPRRLLVEMKNKARIERYDRWWPTDTVRYSTGPNTSCVYMRMSNAKVCGFDVLQL